MNILKCSIEGCDSIFQTEESLHPEAKYICKLHNKTEQKVFFQEYQLDKQLRRASRPIGTEHIHNQGSDVLTADDIGVDSE